MGCVDMPSGIITMWTLYRLDAAWSLQKTCADGSKANVTINESTLKWCLEKRQRKTDKITDFARTQAKWFYRSDVQLPLRVTVWWPA